MPRIFGLWQVLVPSWIKVLPARTILANVVCYPHATIQVDNLLSSVTTTVAGELLLVVLPPSFLLSFVLVKSTVAGVSLLAVLPPSILRCSTLGCMYASLPPVRLFVRKVLCFPLVILTRT